MKFIPTDSRQCDHPSIVESFNKNFYILKAWINGEYNRGIKIPRLWTSITGLGHRIGSIFANWMQSLKIVEAFFFGHSLSTSTNSIQNQVLCFITSFINKKEQIMSVKTILFPCMLYFSKSHSIRSYVFTASKWKKKKKKGFV